VLTVPFYFPTAIQDDFGQAVAASVMVPTMIQGWTPVTSTLWNPPAWSLSAEVFFYLLFPAIAPLLARRGTAWLLGALLGSCALAFVGPVAYQLAFPGGPPAEPHVVSVAGMAQRFVLFGPLFHVPEFLVGMVLGHLFLRHRGLVNRSGGPLLAAGFTIVGVIAYVWGAAASGPLPGVFLQAIFLPVFAIVVWSLAVGRQGLARLLSLPIVVLLGEASYSLYLLHIPVIWTVDWLLQLLPDGGVSLGPTRWVAVIDLTLAIGLSVVVFRWVERPCRVFIRRRLDASQSRRPELQPATKGAALTF
jgi:peptidoglycan/LPS O-acetylase OafA/YrhL